MNYYRPQRLSDALVWLAQNDAGIAAGCTDLLAMTQSQYLHKAGCKNLLDITAIDELAGITHNENDVRIAAATTWSHIIHANLPSAFDGLKSAGREVGSVQIQNTGTIGGNLCNASPAADGVPPLLTLDASVELVSNAGTRTLPLQKFLLGARRTALRKDEILSAILIPKNSLNGASNFIKLGARKYLVISIAMVAVRLELAEDIITNIAISVGSCSAVAVRLEGVEAKLKGASIGVHLPDAVTKEQIAASLAPIDDIRADAGYRLQAAREIVIRAVSQLLKTGARP